MIYNETESRHRYVVTVAEAMMAAARTAPKARGTDNLDIKTVYGEDLCALGEEMRRYSAESGKTFFVRDAVNVEQSEAVVLIGTRIQALGLDCGFCGFPTCAAKNKYEEVPCAFNTNDMGIAVGSACAIAADRRVDNRVMYSAGLAAMNLGWMEGCGAVLAIPLTCASKSPFFDRMPK